MTAPRPEVIIVGGGIAGCATAYWLTKEGASVTLYEPSGIGSHASGYAFGSLPPSTFGERYAGNFSMLAREQHLELYPALSEETGLDYHLISKPYVELAFTEADCNKLKERIADTETVVAREALTWEDAEETRAREPRLAPEVLGSCVYEGTFQLSSFELTQALWAAAAKRGAKLATDTVNDLALEGNTVAGVAGDRGTELADVVVLANGAWIKRFVSLPIQPLQGEILRFAALERPLRDIYFCGSNQYVASKANGLVFAGSTEEPTDSEAQPTASAKHKIYREAAMMVPLLAEAELVQHTACLRAATPDKLPMLGLVEGLSGLAVVGGAGRDGILQGPLMGRVMSQLIVHGETDVPIRGLEPERFSPNGVIELL